MIAEEVKQVAKVRAQEGGTRWCTSVFLHGACVRFCMSLQVQAVRRCYVGAPAAGAVGALPRCSVAAFRFIRRRWLC